MSESRGLNLFDTDDAFQSLKDGEIYIASMLLEARVEKMGVLDIKVENGIVGVGMSSDDRSLSDKGLSKDKDI